VRGSGVDLSGSGWDPMVGSCENETEPPGYTDGRKCIDYLNDYNF
jgi:hypothetical protein